ncbi:MAG: glycosyltransferase family 39 protein, partial [Candidatus Eisenbacteria bacterium]
MTDPRPRERSRRPRAASARAAALPHVRPLAYERLWVVLLLAVHATFALWGAARQSVTFDENFHLPAGVMEVARANFRISAVNPPLVKAMAGAAALAAGARLPSEAAVQDGEQGVVGESFMRNNADRYQRVFFAARTVVVALSLMLGWLVWALSRRLHGPRGALVALGFYAVMPETLAHAGVMTMDLPTALGWFGTVVAFDGFVRSGRWRWAWFTAAGLAFTFL